jgi:hypothetical protein
MLITTLVTLGTRIGFPYLETSFGAISFRYFSFSLGRDFGPFAGAAFSVFAMPKTPYDILFLNKSGYLLAAERLVSDDTDAVLFFTLLDSASAGKFGAVRSEEADFAESNRTFFFNDATLADIFTGPGVSLNVVNAFDDGSALLCIYRENATFFTFVVTGQNNYLVIFFDVGFFNATSGFDLLVHFAAPLQYYWCQ